MKKTTVTMLLAALSFSSIAFSKPVTDVQYIFSTIANPAAVNGEGTRAFRINAAGQIVGDFGQHGFVYSGGIFTTIDVPGVVLSGGITEPLGINNAGQIVGFYADTTGIHGFLYSDGIFTTIDVPGAVFNGRAATGAYAINAAGQIVGDYTDSTGTRHGFLYDSGVFTTIDFPGAYSTLAAGINDAGEIVGSASFPNVGGESGFVYSRGTFMAINHPAAFPQSGGVTFTGDINNKGQIVGYFSDVGGYRGFLYDAGTFTTIPLPPGGDNQNFVLGINEAGRIVGYSGNHGFLGTPTHRP